MGDAGVETAGNWVFYWAVVGAEERPHFYIGSIGPTKADNPESVGSDDADADRVTSWKVRFQVENGLAAFKHHCQPTRAVIGPVSIEDLRSGDVQSLTDSCQVRLINWSEPDRLGRSERQAAIESAKFDKAERALGNDLARVLGLASGFEPRVACADSGVASEWKLGPGCEYPHEVIRRPVSRRHQESCL